MNTFVRSVLALTLALVGCVAGNPEAPLSDAPYDAEPIHFELADPVSGFDDPALVAALWQLDEAPVGSTLRYPREVILEDGSRVEDLVTVRVDELSEEAPDVVVEELHLLDDPLLPIAACRTAATVGTRSRTRTWESCVTYPDTEARNDAERAVRSSVDASCRTTLDPDDGAAFCRARGERFIDGPSTVSSDGICERESVSVAVARSRGANTCLFGAYATFRSRATATSTSPSCGFACQ